MRNIAVLFSGNGSNMENIVHSLRNGKFVDSSGNSVELIFALGVCNNPNAYGLVRAQNLKLPCKVLNHRDFNTRESYDEALCEVLRAYRIDLCVLAGFMRILSPIFTHSFRAINIHPSFLPAHKGANAIKDSFESADSYGGVSIHWVSDELDSGKIIMQEKIEKIAGENLEDFTRRIHALEYDLYPKAILKALKLKVIK